MRQLFASLNLRLALILFVALGASYSLMTWLLHDRVIDAGATQFAAGVAAQVRQAEAALASGGALPPGSRLEAAPGRSGRRDARPERRTDPETSGRAHGLHGPANERYREIRSRVERALAAELGRPVDMRLGGGGGRGPGVWVRLADAEGRWLWVPAPPPPLRPGWDAVIVLPAVAFMLAFIVGLFLLVQVNRPLARLGEAMGRVGAGGGAPVRPEGPAEIRRLAERFNAMIARLADLERDRATMLAGIAHDLRTPLTRLQLQIELADGPRKAAMQHELDVLAEQFEQFRLFAGGGSAEALEARDLGLLADEVLAPWRERGLVLDLPEGLRAAVRPAALRRVLTNLVENAFAYGAPPVEVRLGEAGGKVVLSVRDHGPGIAPDQLDEARRPFVRLDPARGGSGHSGLGLAIADRLLAEQGARLELENAAEGGLCARLLFDPCAVPGVTSA